MFALKLLVLKTGEYDLWSMRKEQYLTFTNHALWEVIVNGDSFLPVASASTGAEGPILPKTAEQKQARKNEDAKSLWEAIKNRFGGNKESKKMQKTILKQNYENFTTSSQEGLDKTYDRFQKLISQLEFHGEVISQEDANLKLLRSLPSAWNNIALIMRNKYDLDTLSMDDLYNNLKVYESKIKGKSSSSSNSQNINADDLEEMDLKWQMEMLTMRVKRRGHFSRECRALKNRGNRNRDDPRRNAPAKEGITKLCSNAIHIKVHQFLQVSDSDGTILALKIVYNHLKTLQKQYDQQREALNKSNLEISGYQMGLESLEDRIVVHEKNEAVYKEDIAFLKYDVQVKDISTKDLKNQLEEALKEKDDLKLKTRKFEENHQKNLIIEKN
ncbi:hypothetical protein Tco_0770524 [Tanacetum coccineum]|uniref:Uncharacterized protein n=1 Tax=Tanacetum coccineum TaxID=301880 RepID=A0ABQ4ZG60_9ASTR